MRFYSIYSRETTFVVDRAHKFIPCSMKDRIQHSFQITQQSLDSCTDIPLLSFQQSTTNYLTGTFDQNRRLMNGLVYCIIFMWGLIIGGCEAPISP